MSPTGWCSAVKDKLQPTTNREILTLAGEGKVSNESWRGMPTTWNSRGRTLPPHTRQCRSGGFHSGPNWVLRAPRVMHRGRQPLLFPMSIRRHARRHRQRGPHVFRCTVNVLSHSVDKELAPIAKSGIGTTRTGTTRQITMTDGCGPRCRAADVAAHRGRATEVLRAVPMMAPCSL